VILKLLMFQRLNSSRVGKSKCTTFKGLAKDTYHKYSDIDLAVFWDKDEIDGFDEDVLLMKLTRRVDLRIEPHSFAKSDFDETNPYIKEIIETGERII
jgi:hypothetical protein